MNQTSESRATPKSAGAQRIIDSESLVEVFQSDDEMLARMVLDQILGPAGVSGTLHERRSRSIVAPAAMPGQIGVAVPRSEAKKARQVLKAAREDGVLSDGTFIDADPDA